MNVKMRATLVVDVDGAIRGTADTMEFFSDRAFIREQLQPESMPCMMPTKMTPVLLSRVMFTSRST